MDELEDTVKMGHTPVTRRRFLAQMGAASVLICPGWNASSLSQARTGDDSTQSTDSAVSFTPTAFVVGGQPCFLAAGSMDYFRCPAELWHDRILKAKRAGLNTIMTYVAWNQHEREEGTYHFAGRADLAAFLRSCAELEMLAIVRVGPFICDEFEMGGHPAWLLGKPNVELRIRSAAAEPYIERWFAQLCKHIAPLQVTQGGPVVLVQAENEYYYAQRPGAAEYLEYLYQTLRRNGIDVPISGCGDGTEVQTPAYFETVNGYRREAAVAFRQRHPAWPLLISEHYTDWFDVWTWPQTDYPKRPMLEQESLEALSQGVMLSYFCFHGGTNFGFNASSSWKTDHTWVTNCYFGQGPVAEGGALNPNYFAVKSASLPVAQFETFFASAVSVSSLPDLAGPVTASGLRSERGTLIFILPVYPIRADQRTLADGDAKPVSLLEDRPTPEMEAATGAIRLPIGTWVPLAAGSARVLMLPLGFRIDHQNVVDYANGTLLGIGGNADRRVILLWGETGREGHVSVNGAAVDFRFPNTEPLLVKTGRVTVIALSPLLADRTWFADGRVIIGPAFVAEKIGARHICFLDEQTELLVSVEKDGTLQRRSIPPNSIEAEPTTSPVALLWKRTKFAELQPQSSGWKALDGPRPVEGLGSYHGYSWYRARVSSPAERGTGLLFTAAADRAHVWVNAKYAGVCGRGAAAKRDLLPIHLPGEEALITMLVDNMGRSSEGSTQQRKGIWGLVYAGAGEETLSAPSLQPGTIPTELTWQFEKFRIDAGPRASCHVARWNVHARNGSRFFLALRDVPQYAWIYLDGALVGEHHGDNALLDGFAASDYLLPPFESRPAELTIYFYGETQTAGPQGVHLYSFPVEGALHSWEFRPWASPGVSSAPSESPGYANDVKEPCWWQAECSQTGLKAPLFFATRELTKGQVYLNQEPVGRYWELGPHHRVYLPENLLQPVNTIGLIDEGGASPDKTFLMRDANVPTTTIMF